VNAKHLVNLLVKQVVVSQINNAKRLEENNR